ncbi:MAG: D-alanyl-D-alanine carboxypeptidase family protein [Lachnospiraceae bacterium]|nr:D-alanyl-D-alanine carboxypeptidase family protein [Lachnospiraceae bacterium]
MFKKIRKLLIVSLLAVTVSAGSTVSAMAEVNTEAASDTYAVDSDSWAGWPQAPGLLGVTGCLYDMDTGAVLYAKGMDEQRFPASITKIMTALVVVEHADLNAQVTFTETGLADAFDGSSNINPKLGETFTVDEMLQMLLVKSANDAGTQLAEYVGGSVEAFAAMMNQKAAELGCTNTHFVNACGLENDDHYTSAHDMALIMRAAIQYDRIREIMNVQSIQIDATEYTDTRYYDTHLLMLVPESEYYYEGALGGKTGYTPISGCTLVMYAARGDRTLIGVVMGGGDSNLICLDMADLFDYGFNNFSYTDMTDGYPMISGGTALLPNGIDPSLVQTNAETTAEGVALSYVCNGQILGTGLMSEDAYTAWQTALHPELQNEMEAAEAEGETGITDSEGIPFAENAEAENTESSSQKKSKRTIFMYIAVAALVIAAAACVVLVIMTSDKYQRSRRERKRRNQRDQ